MAVREGGRTALEWALYLDESGNFAAPDEPVCIAGVMLQEAPSQEADEILRSVLKRIDPIAWYPPHATELRLTAWWVAAWALASPSARDAHPQARTLEHAAALCALACEEPPLVAMFAALRRERCPSYDALKTASWWLHRRHRAVNDALRDIANEADRQYRLVASRLVDQYGPSRCFVVAASDDGAEPPPASGPRDRYLALLVVLLERVFALLRTRPAERHTVRVVVAGRNVLDPALGARPLRAQDVGDCVRRAERFPLDPPREPADPWVRLVPAMTTRYDALTPPGVVLADFIANRCRRALHATVSWSTLRDELVATTHLPVEVTARALPTMGPRPTIAAAGAARVAITRAFEPDAPDVPVDPGGPWPVEQARRWAEVAAALRAGGAR